MSHTDVVCHVSVEFAKVFWDSCHMNIDRERFGRIVESRRMQLGYSQTGVEGGPSSTTLSRIERGVQDPITTQTLRKLDDGLRWQRGSAYAALHGGEPVELEAAGVTSAIELTDDELLAELTYRMRRYARQEEGPGNGNLPAKKMNRRGKPIAPTKADKEP